MRVRAAALGDPCGCNLGSDLDNVREFWAESIRSEGMQVLQLVLELLALWRNRE